MSLEKLKNEWSDLERFSEIKRTLSKEEITASIQSKYHRLINRVLFLEFFVSLILSYFTFFLVVMFGRLEFTYLKVIAVLSIILMLFFITTSFLKFRSSYRQKAMNFSHVIALKNLAKQKIRINKFYIANIILGFLLIVLLAILNVNIYNEFEVVHTKAFWLILIPCSFTFALSSNRWIKNSYAKVIKDSRELIQELD